MFDEMRRSDRRLSNLETESILSAGEYGVLSTVGEDGYPYGVPVNYIYRNGRIYFHCAALQGKKLKNIQFSDKVCFTVVTQAEVLPRELSTRYESAVIFGRARRVGEGKQEVLRALCARFAADDSEQIERALKTQAESTDVIEITPEYISGKGRK